MTDAVVSFLWADAAANEVLLDSDTLDEFQLRRRVSARCASTDGWGIVDADVRPRLRRNVQGPRGRRLRRPADRHHRRAHQAPRARRADHGHVLRHGREPDDGRSHHELRGERVPFSMILSRRRAHPRPACGRRSGCSRSPSIRSPDGSDCPAIRRSSAPRRRPSAARHPALGEHTDEILTEFGLRRRDRRPARRERSWHERHDARGAQHRGGHRGRAGARAGERDGLAVVNVASSGICGSDLHMLEWGALPFTLGHEIGGHLDDGTPVTVWPLVPCGSATGAWPASRSSAAPALSRIYGVGPEGGHGRPDPRRPAQRRYAAGRAGRPSTPASSSRSRARCTRCAGPGYGRATAWPSSAPEASASAPRRWRVSSAIPSMSRRGTSRSALPWPPSAPGSSRPRQTASTTSSSTRPAPRARSPALCAAAPGRHARHRLQPVASRANSRCSSPPEEPTIVTANMHGPGTQPGSGGGHDRHGGVGAPARRHAGSRVRDDHAPLPARPGAESLRRSGRPLGRLDQGRARAVSVGSFGASPGRDSWSSPGSCRAGAPSRLQHPW